jgi:hypothetical protein
LTGFLLFFLKKQHGDTKVHRPIYLRITIDGVIKEMDIFLFSCYTGLAYSDVQKLRRSEISTGIDGGKWIFTRRQKTDTASRIPILPIAKTILLRYADHPNAKQKIGCCPFSATKK